jgi:hypothetical protein
MALAKVKNRSGGVVTYTIPEMGDKRNVIRSFAPQEIKTIDETELQALSYVPGGTILLENYLQILDEKIVENLALEVEPEYNMSEEDIIDLMKNGSLDAFLDCLDFAPEGVKELIKTYSIKLPLNDSAKRDAVKAKLGFDVDKALMIVRESQTEETKTETKGRRVKPATDSNRRSELPTYKIVD